jgi:hypothetical protein
MVTDDCHITLFVPGLLGPQPVLSQLPASDLPDLHQLERALSRATRQLDQVDNAYTGMFRLFNIEPDPAGDYPAAAICQSVQQLELNGFCLRADPVHLQADMNSAVLRGHHELRLDDDEARQLVEKINAHLQQDGLQLIMGQPHHWYIVLDKTPELQTSPLPTLLFQDINAHLPRGSGAGDWRRLLNEIQMLLYDHPVNLQREEAGRLTVNSLWLWGGGRLPDRASINWQQVYTDDWLLDALARFNDIDSDDLPESVDELLAECHGQVLIGIDDCLVPLRQNNPFTWLEAVQQFQNLWLQPLIEALQQHRCNTLTLLPADGRRYTLTRKTLRRWWKRRRPLQHWVSDGI